MGYYKPCAEFDECSRIISEYYEKGLYKECFDRHMKLAEQGYPLAECQIGWFYTEGLGVEKDLAKAFYWTERAALHGDRDAQYNLAEFYLDGTAVERDTAAAHRWLVSAAKQESAEAIERCAELGIDIA